jgi:hypothetical protein
MRRTVLLIALTIALLASSSGVAMAANLVTNGDFEAGDTGFTSEYTYVASPGPQALWNEMTYAVGVNPQQYHYLWSSYFDHTKGDGTGKMMIVNGSDEVADKIVWSEAIAVNPNRPYRFSLWGATSYPAAYAVLDVYINDVWVGQYSAPTVVATWSQYTVDWNSGAATTADVELICNTLVHTGDDFALDDISFEPLSLDVLVDIKPGSDPSAFNWDGHGKVPVAVLGSDVFDVYEINPATVTMNNAGVALRGKKDPTVMASYSDVNGDGYTDLVVQIADIDGAIFAVGDTTATIAGYLYDGTYFSGVGDIKLVPEG